jgi:hypothetical protein
MTISNSPNPSFRFPAGFLSFPFQIFVCFSYPVCLSSFPSVCNVCLLACRSNIRFFQLSCLPIFLSLCLLACLSFKYSFLSVIRSA